MKSSEQKNNSDSTQSGYCKERVFSGERWDFRGHQCTRKSKRNGWCSIHHPDVVAERQRKQKEKWDQQAQQNQWEVDKKKLERLVIEAALAHYASTLASDGDDFDYGLMKAAQALRGACRDLVEHEERQP